VAFQIGKTEDKVVLPWVKLKDPYWRHPIVLKIDQDFVLLKESAKIVNIQPVREEDWKGRSVKKGLVTPLRSKERMQQKFLTAYGYGALQGRVLLFNPTDKSIKLKKNTRYASTQMNDSLFERKEEMEGFQGSRKDVCEQKSKELYSKEASVNLTNGKETQNEAKESSWDLENWNGNGTNRARGESLNERRGETNGSESTTRNHAQLSYPEDQNQDEESKQNQKVKDCTSSQTTMRHGDGGDVKEVVGLTLRTKHRGSLVDLGCLGMEVGQEDNKHKSPTAQQNTETRTSLTGWNRPTAGAGASNMSPIGLAP
jgi:hypothetical protein